MDRRTFLGTVAGGLLAAPPAGEAQQVAKVPRIGVLAPGAVGSGAMDAFSVDFAT